MTAARNPLKRLKRACRITVEDTPNPAAMKFTVDCPIGGDRPRSYDSPEAAADDPLASRIFALRHVSNVMIVNNFCTVNKTSAGRWKTLTPQIKSIMADLLSSPDPK